MASDNLLCIEQTQLYLKYTELQHALTIRAGTKS